MGLGDLTSESDCTRNNDCLVCHMADNFWCLYERENGKMSGEVRSGGEREERGRGGWGGEGR